MGYIRISTIVLIMLSLSMVTAQDSTRTPLQWTPMAVPGLGSPVNTLSISPHDNKRLLAGTRQAGAYWSDDQGESWHSSTGISCLNVLTFMWHPTSPTIVWAGTINGVYYSDDGGQTWESRSEGMPTDAFSESYTYLVPIRQIIMDPVNKNRLLAFCGVIDAGMVPQARVGGVWETLNGGLRWHKLCAISLDGETNNPAEKGVNITGAAFAGDLPILLYASSSEAGFFESLDGGKSWTKRNTGLPHENVSGMQLSSKNMDTVWLNLGAHKEAIDSGDSLPGGIYKTISGGLGWFSLTSKLPSIEAGTLREVTAFSTMAVAPSDPNIIYACDSSTKVGIIYKSTDAGITWTPVATQKHSESDQTEEQKALSQIKTFLPVGLSDVNAMVVDPANPAVVFIAGDAFVIRSKDGGSSWEELSAKPVSDSTWTGRGLNGLDVMDIIWDPSDGNRIILAAGNSAKFLDSQDSGVSWTLRGTDRYTWGGGSSGCIANGKVYLGTGQFGLFGSVVRYDGTEWKTLTGKEHTLPPFRRCGQVTGIHAWRDNPNAVDAVIGGRLYGSRDGGGSWKPLFQRRDLGWIAPIPGSRNFYVSGKQNTYYVVGPRFDPIGGPKSAGRVATDSRGHLYLAARKSLRGGLWRYNRKEWTRLLDENLISDVAVDPTDPLRIAICTAASSTAINDNSPGIWLSSDGGKTWAQSNVGLPLLKANCISFNPHDPTQLLVGTAGAGVFTLSWPKGVTIKGVKDYVATAEDKTFSGKLAVTYGSGGIPGMGPGGKQSPLRNGDMELGNMVPMSWTNRWVGSGNVIVARDTTTAFEGEASLRIQTVGGPGKGQIAQIISASDITEVTLTAQVKGEGGMFAQVAIQSFDARWKTLQYKTIGYFRKQEQWKELKGTAKLPPGTVRFGVGLLIEGKGKAWMDNVVLEVK